MRAAPVGKPARATVPTKSEVGRTDLLAFYADSVGRRPLDLISPRLTGQSDQLPNAFVRLWHIADMQANKPERFVNVPFADCLLANSPVKAIARAR